MARRGGENKMEVGRRGREEGRGEKRGRKWVGKE